MITTHGGSYSSGYFDVPGCSLLGRVACNGIAAVAIDRPGYNDSPMLSVEEMDIAGQARFLRAKIAEIWGSFGAGKRGVVLVGHSIGAAIASSVAASEPAWPLIGLAISGVGMTSSPGDHERWRALPDVPLVMIPDEVKDQVMFGPVGSYGSEMSAASHGANASAPKAELLAIPGVWNNTVRSVLADITGPVHYRQGEFDKLWIVDDAEIEKFAAALSISSSVDARLVHRAGHCIDFHEIGPALHLQQLGFALDCAAGVD